MICPSCQTDNRDGAKFCNECGFDLRALAAVGKPAEPACSSDLADEAYLAKDEAKAAEDEAETQFGAVGEASDQPEASGENMRAPNEPAASDMPFAPPSAPDKVIAEAIGEVRALRESVPPIIKVPAIAADVPSEYVPGPVAASTPEPVLSPAQAPTDEDDPAACDTRTSNGSEVADAFSTSVLHPAVTPFDEAQAMFGEKAASPEVTADLSGLERLVDSSYVPPTPANRAGDTMELPRIEGEQKPVATSFRAMQSRSELRRQKRAQRKLEREQAKRARELQRQGATPVDASVSGSLAASSGAVELAADESGAAQGEGTRAKSRRALVVALVVVVCAVCACAAAGVTYSMELWGGKVVPNVAGASQADARYLLEEKGFSAIVTQVKSDEAEGLVLESVPGAGARAEAGSAIELRVAAARVIPEVAGKTEADVHALIDEEGFTNVTYVLVKSNEPEGTALSVSPEPGAHALSGDAITVEIAQAYTVPDVAGASAADATEALEAEGYEVVSAWYNTEDIAEGTAVSTDPEAGSKLASGSRVTLYVAHNRSTELIGFTRAFFTDSPQVTYNGTPYRVDASTLVVDYVGNNTVSYSVQGVEIGYIFGIAIENPNGAATLTGTITWNDDNDIAAVSPSLKQGA